MRDRTVSVTKVIAWVLWIAGVALIIADMVTVDLDPLSDLGMIVGGSGLALHIRGFLLEMNQRLHDAYELGKADEQRRVRPVR